jgi:SAM-dependent methyltransferase
MSQLSGTRTAPRAKTLDTRASFLAHARGLRQTVDKDDFIVALCTGRAVLDIGCVDHSAQVQEALGATWLHHRIRQAAAETTGLDHAEQEALQLNARGYNVVVGDAHTFDLGRPFDVIVAGDVIEHLNNPGQFLERCAMHMAPGSLLVLTTPNPFNLEQAVRALLQNSTVVNEDHTAWFDPEVLWELTSRHGLRVVDFAWLKTRFTIPMARRARVDRALRMVVDSVVRRRPSCGRDFGVVLQLSA